ncbi:Hypothetical predicted protein [Octopus vulgaris]|uniref:Uncharacterized protein n=1 Tax=Octopus vulgaris TaxID=6645 RepID=A0AA36AX43_OCTVU|nr:Hypothetical predicted protein [Octopus vulgaris]
MANVLGDVNGRATTSLENAGLTGAKLPEVTAFESNQCQGDTVHKKCLCHISFDIDIPYPFRHYAGV